MCNPIGLLMGLLALTTTVSLFLYLKSNKRSVQSFQADHPVLVVSGVFVTGWFLVYLIDCVAVFLTATLFPVLLMFVHSSCRKRGLKNKLNDAMETAGLRRSPMAIVLDYVQVEVSKLE